jgi:hypothetical protein
MARARAVITTWGSCIQRHPMTPPRPNPAPHQANRLGHLSGPLGQLSGRILSRKHRGPVARNYMSCNGTQAGKGHKLYLPGVRPGRRNIFPTWWLLQQPEIRARDSGSGHIHALEGAAEYDLVQTQNYALFCHAKRDTDSPDERSSRRG